MTNIISKDLNLLNIFAAIWEERNVSKAAKRLHLTQSAVSQALGRLRDMMGDDLFVRAPRGVTPTRQAEQWAPQIQRVLAEATKIFETETAFDPAKAQGVLRLASTEYFEQVALPKLIAILRKEAPGLVLVSRPAGGELPKAGLESGELDVVVVGYFQDLPEGYYRQRLFEDSYACVVAKSHPTIKQRLTLKDYLAHDHALITLQGDLRGSVDRALEKLGEKRRVVVGIQSFLTPGWIAAASDLIVTAPRTLCTMYKRNLEVKMFDPPLDLPPIQVDQIWHERSHRDPLSKWFREKVRVVVQEAAAELA